MCNNLIDYITTAINITKLVYYGIQWEKFRGSNNSATKCNCVARECKCYWCAWQFMIGMKSFESLVQCNIMQKA